MEGLIREIESNRKEMTSKFEGLNYWFEKVEEITALKLKVADLEKRFAAA